MEKAKGWTTFNNCIDAFNWLEPQIRDIAASGGDIQQDAQRAAELIQNTFWMVDYVGVYSLHSGELLLKVGTRELTPEEKNRTFRVAKKVFSTRQPVEIPDTGPNMPSVVGVPVMDGGVFFAVAFMIAVKDYNFNNGAIIGLSRLADYFARRLLND